MAILTLEQCKRRALPSLSGEGSGQDDLVSALLVGADALLAQFLGFPANDSGVYTLESSAYTEYFDRADPGELTELTPNAQPIESVTQVSEDSTGNRSYATTVTSGDYSLVLVDGLWTIYRYDGWVRGRRYTRVKYVAGFGADNADIAHALAAQVRHMYDQRQMAGVQAVASQTGSTTYSLSNNDIAQQAQQILGRYRRPGRFLA